MTAVDPAGPERDRLSDVIFEAVRDQPYSYADGADQAAAAVRSAFAVIDPADVNLNNLFQAFVARFSAAIHSPFGATVDEARRAGIDGVLAELGIEVTA